MNIAVISRLPDNLILAKFTPLWNLPEVNHIYFVTDEPGITHRKLTYVVPSRALLRAFRHKALAKFVLLFWTAWKYDCTFVTAYNLIPHGYSAFIVGKMLGKPVFQHLIQAYSEVEVDPNRSDNSLVAAFPAVVNLLTSLNRYIMRHSDHIFVPGGRTRRALEDNLHIDSRRISVLHSTIDLDRFSPVAGSKSTDAVVVASLSKRKRVDIFVMAIAEIQKKNRDISAVVLGKGPEMENLRQLAKKLGIDSNVKFEGFHSNTQDYYNQSRVFVLTSVDEGLSCSAMEAMACGLPVVVSDVGDMDEVAKDNLTGYLITAYDEPNQFADAIMRVLSDPERYASMSANAIELIRREHSVAVATAMWSELISGYGLTE